jgi:transposase-like protein
MNPQEVFCPNNDCPSRGKLGQGNIHVHSYAQRRYRCSVCTKTFAATRGTPLYRLRSDEESVARVVTLLAFGCPPAAIVAAFGLDARTVATWQRRAGAHCERVHQERVLSTPQDLGYVQADEVRVKLQRRLVLWMAMAICVPTRLWLGGVVNRRRDRSLIGELAAKVKACARFAPLLLVSDGFCAYVSAWKKAFRTPLHTGRRGRPALVAWPGVVIGQVLKVKEKGRVIGVVQSVVAGSLAQVLALLPPRQGLNTIYIERLNGTFRARLAGLVRRTRSLLRQEARLHGGMYLVGTVYNFCTPHQSLKGQTPAQAAGLTHHCWSVAELLGYRVAPPPWSPPKRKRRSRQAKQEGMLCTV